MKKLKQLLFIILVFTAISCKKNNPPPKNTECGCDALEIKYKLQEYPSKLAFSQNKRQWYFYVESGVGSLFFPCNKNQDSLKKILQNANDTQTFQVKLSGKVKNICPNEDFGVTQNATIDYIIIDSLKKN